MELCLPIAEMSVHWPVILGMGAAMLSGGRKPGQHDWIHGLLFKRRFRGSRLYIGAFPPMLLAPLTLSIAGRLLYSLAITPADIYRMTVGNT